MRWLLVVLGVLASSGCQELTPFHGDVTFTAEEREAILRGGAFISGHTSGEPISVVWDAPHRDDDCNVATIMRHDKGAGGIAELGEEHCISLGIGPGLDLAAVAAHEFGHWKMGADHVQHGLMQPWNMVLEWTADDQAHCVAAGRC